jgi:hypothetical protein
MPISPPLPYLRIGYFIPEHFEVHVPQSPAGLRFLKEAQCGVPKSMPAFGCVRPIEIPQNDGSHKEAVILPIGPKGGR